MDFLKDNMDMMEGLKETGLRRSESFEKLYKKVMFNFVNKESGEVEPDTIGADYFFVQGFITEDMHWEFPFITQDFFSHCFSKISSLDLLTLYGSDSINECLPDRFSEQRVMTMLYNGAKAGDPYCVELVRYLYKIYHKQEYKQLKRFRTISADEIASLGEDETGDPDCEAIGRILGMCGFMGITKDESCSILYIMLEHVREEYLEAENRQPEDPLDDTLFQECMEQAEKFVEEDKRKRPKNTDRVYRKYKRFAEAVLKNWDYPEEYVYMTLESYYGTKIEYARTLKQLRLLYPEKEFTFEEVQTYAQMYTLLTFGRDMSEHYQMAVEELLGYGTELYYRDIKDGMLYKRDFVSGDAGKAGKKEAAPSVQKKPASSVSDTVPDADKEEQYKKEIEILRKKVHMQEGEISHLRTAYRTAVRSREELEGLAAKHERERDELIALRNYVYQLEQQEAEEAKISSEEMKAAIQNRKIAVIGGHANWLKKLSREFPKWKIIATESYNTVEGNALKGMDMVFFFTDHISHSTYNRYINAVRDHKVPFSFLHGINMEHIIRTVYETLQEVQS